MKYWVIDKLDGTAYGPFGTLAEVLRDHPTVFLEGQARYALTKELR